MIDAHALPLALADALETDPALADRLRAVLAAKATPAPVRQRLSVGAREYGTSSDRPVPETLDQIAEELADVCGWSVVAFARIEALKARAEILDATHAPAPDAARPSTSRSRSGSGT